MSREGEIMLGMVERGWRIRQTDAPTRDELIAALRRCLPWLAKCAADRPDDDPAGVAAGARRMWDMVSDVIARAEAAGDGVTRRQVEQVTRQAKMKV